MCDNPRTSIEDHIDREVCFATKGNGHVKKKWIEDNASWEAILAIQLRVCPRRSIEENDIIRKVLKANNAKYSV